MADLPELDRAEAVKIAGANPTSGIADNFLEVDVNGYIGARLYDASGTALDTNYGAVAAHTLRTASQIGNATGAADFAAGNSSAQTLRVVIATNQSAIPASQSGTWNITNISGTISLPTGAATEATLAKLPLAQGSATSGQSGILEQGAVTTAAPTYVTGQTSPLSLTTAGALRTDGSGVTQPISAASLPLPTGAATETTLSALNTKVNSDFGASASAIRVAALLGNATGSAAFNAGLTTAQTLRVVLPTDQSAIPVTQSGTWNITNITGTVSLPTGAATAANQSTEITSLQLIDNPIGPVAAGTAGTNSFLMGGVFNTALPTLTTGQQVALQLDSSGRMIIAPLANTSVVKAQLQDNSGNGLTSDNGQLLVQDTVNVAGQNRAQSVTTSAAEALGAATILVNRKFISLTPTNGTIYWGFVNTVTTATGTPIFKNQTVTMAITDNVHIYVIAAQTTDVRIAEGR